MDINKVYEAEERNYSSAILSIIRSDISDEELRISLEEYHDNDIALAIEDLEGWERERLLNVIGAQAMSEILSYIDDAGEYLSELDATKTAEIIEHMDADEALEALDTFDDELRTEVLELIEDEVKEDIELIDSYDDDEFGSRMSTNFIAVSKNSTVKSAMRKLVSEAAQNDNIHTLFAVEDDGRFFGAIDLQELIIARSDKPFEELIFTNFPYVYDKEIISENLERLRTYSEDLIPVLSSEGDKLVGVITANDIADMIDDELEEDYAKLAALDIDEDKKSSVFYSSRKRIPWLAALLFMGLAVSAVVGLFENVVKELPLIVSFQSLILGMAGNVGTQSLAVTVRKLGSDELDTKKQLGLIFKETRVALVNGIVLGIFSFAVVFAYLALMGGHSIDVSISTAVCVSIALCFAMMISGFTGAFIPICLYRMKLDPAVASGPLITTVNDLVAVVSYYGLAWLLLLSFAA